VVVTGRRRLSVRRRAGALLLLVVVVGFVAPSRPAPVEAGPAPLGPAARWALDHGIATRFPDGSFRGSRPVNRGEGATWLWRQAASPGPSAAAWVVSEGLETSETYQPAGPLLRRVFVRWLWTLAGEPDAGPPPHPDVPDRAAYATAVAWAVDEGILAGTGRFRPRTAITRGEAATWLWRQAGRPDGTETNVVFVLTDDQSLAALAAGTPRAEELIGGDHGTTFTQMVASFPLCCPARATLYSGQYSHNHGVLGNEPPLGGYPRFDHDTALPTWFQDAGYHTGFVGKYLNWYGGRFSDPVVPPGWERWWGWTGQVGDGTGYYFNYEANVDGETVLYGDADEDYVTDVIADRSEADLRAMWADGRPFFLHVSHVAPHAGVDDRTLPVPFGASPAPRHVGTSTAELPQPPNFDEADLSDKPPWLQRLGQHPESVFNTSTPDDQRAGYRSYLESLASVDESVEQLMATLDELGALDDTLVVFASDNGYLWGEHGIMADKQVPYEESVRVPLLIRGPGFPAGATVDTPMVDADLAPTLARAAGVTPTTVVDGIPIQELMARPTAWADRAVLLENWPPGSKGRTADSVLYHHFEGVRTSRFTYTEHDDGGVALYDRLLDPYELVSRHEDPAYEATIDALADTLHELLGCSGRASCTARVDPPVPP
jgi:arylsulfatase A-like enzyme